MESAAQRAERILSKTFGGPIHLGEAQDLGGSARSKVLRFSVLEGPDTAPRSIIVKHINSETFDPHSTNDATWYFFNDWASLQFLDQVTSSPLAPRLYGGERETGLLVMEDIQQITRLDHLLLGDDPNAAEAGLMAYAKLHGHLHALSINHQNEYLRIREYLGPTKSADDFYTFLWLPTTLEEVARLLDVPVQPGASHELERLITALTNPGPFLSFVQSDAAPDNILFDGERWRLIDFEGATYMHALLEGAYIHMPFPTCWCVYRIPDPLVQRLEDRYRVELARACPAASDDTLFKHSMAEACITWVLFFHKWICSLEKLLIQDQNIVALSDRQRFLLYMENATRSLEYANHLPALGNTLRLCAKRLTQLWPEAVDPPYYPAFR
ncbi:phosphotransferase [Ktedonospora formicarum]|uniref:Aminoglycoside phosphotransferase domain-containing protein n=1 Tax=Ktedonospora formicarum TaxID=2778364 RepID=A0A8J3HZU5_9CHLR|nr:phosphotransferase [Ktedonospora formicarum]GHO46754.1 hypothetical protein KSX_49170 [Ktedonospora formicarum]